MTNETRILLWLLFGMISTGLLEATYLHFHQRRGKQKR